jgi:hypothetical protein
MDCIYGMINDYLSPCTSFPTQSNCPKEEVKTPLLVAPEAVSIGAARLIEDSRSGRPEPLAQIHVRYSGTGM